MSDDARPVRESHHEASQLMMPQHANVLGNVFGGVVLSMMDTTAAVSAISAPSVSKRIFFSVRISVSDRTQHTSRAEQ